MKPPSGAGVAAAVVALALAVACSSSTPTAPAVGRSTTGSTAAGTATTATTTAGTPATTAAPSGATADWPTYHGTNDRTGRASGTSRPASLKQSWAATLDGAVYGQPLAVAGSVIVATENDTVYAFAPTGGPARWRIHLASPVPTSALQCGNINPLGITGTPAYDATTGSVFVVTESTGGVHDLVALDALTGALRWSRNLDVGGHDRLAEQERGALAVANGRVYVPFGGLFGDCGDYVGYVTAVATDGSGAVAHYAVPTRREGGIWAASGPAIGSDGTVYVAAGNGAAESGSYDGSDAVIHLSADLSSRLDFFAPTDWAAENASDRDLGSTGPLLLAGGLAVIAGKAGTVYLLHSAGLGGIGGQVASLHGCTGFGGMASDQGAVFVPCEEGLERIDVTSTSLKAGWRVDATGSPVVGGGAVWALDSGGTLFAFDETTGATLARVKAGDTTRFASPVLAGDRVFVGTEQGLVAVAIN